MSDAFNYAIGELIKKGGPPDMHGDVYIGCDFATGKSITAMIIIDHDLIVPPPVKTEDAEFEVIEPLQLPST